jgi:hypothetical protein
MRNSGLARLTVVLLGALTSLVIQSAARAGTIAYVTAVTGIYAWDTGSNSVSYETSAADGGAIDSLILDTGGEIVYSIISTNSIGKYNPSTHSNTILASGANFAEVADIALDPSGATFLVSNASGDSIDRVNATTGVMTTLYNGGLRPDGLAIMSVVYLPCSVRMK